MTPETNALIPVGIAALCFFLAFLYGRHRRALALRHRVAAVSYTHLDVYKRQDFLSPCFGRIVSAIAALSAWASPAAGCRFWRHIRSRSPLPEPGGDLSLIHI